MGGARRATAGPGSLEPGAPATFAVWDLPAGLDPDAGPPLPLLTPGAPLPTCLRTVVDGRTIHETEDAP